MIIVEDSRQQNGKHDTKEEWFTDNGTELVRSKLVFGDYALPPKVSIDTKRNMAEIAQNIGGKHTEHERFRNECLLAQKCGSKLYILVENTEGISCLEQVQFWENPRSACYANAIDGKRLYKAMNTMQERYGVTFLFCEPSESAQIIQEILEREG